MRDAHALVREFFRQLQAGDLSPELFTEGMRGRTTTQGEHSGARYRESARILHRMTDGRMRFEILQIIAEGDSAAAQVMSECQLINGEEYRNRYVFLFRFEGDRIAMIDETFDRKPVEEKLIPLMRELPADE